MLTLYVDLEDGWSGAILYLTAIGSAVAPNPAGYALTGLGNYRYHSEIAEPVNPATRLNGDYRCVAKTGSGDIIGYGYLRVGEGDDEATVRNEQILASEAALIELAASVENMEDTLSGIAAAGVVIQYPYNRFTKKIILTRKTSYKHTHGRSVEIQPVNSAGTVVVNGWPDLTGATIKFGAGRNNVKDVVVGTGSVVTPTGSQMVRIEFTSLQTDVTPGVYRFEVQATIGGDPIDLCKGDLVIEEGYAS